GWRLPVVHVDVVSPRVHTLEANLLPWSPRTKRAIEGDVVAIPEFGSPDEVEAWIRAERGKIVLATSPEPTCREPQALERLAQPETVQRLNEQRRASQVSWARRLQMLGPQPHRRLEDARATAVLTSLC